jgi:type III secretion protein W
MPADPEPAELRVLINETRTLQAILNLYRYFERKMPLIYNLFEMQAAASSGIDFGEVMESAFPPHLNYELLTDTFVNLIEERYPSAEKVLQLIGRLNLETVQGKIIILSVYRDAIKEMSPQKIYRSAQHRDDLYMAIIEALEELEDELEELEEQQAAEEE